MDTESLGDNFENLEYNDAERLFTEAQRQAQERYETYVRLEKNYNGG